MKPSDELGDVPEVVPEQTPEPTPLDEDVDARPAPADAAALDPEVVELEVDDEEAKA